MPAPLRPCVPDALIFVTVCLLDRGSDLLRRHVDLMRAAVRQTKAERPFAIEAWVTLPDHFHAVLRLPAGDADPSTRIAAIKARFARGLNGAGRALEPSAIGGRAAQAGLWQRQVGVHAICDAAELDAHIRACWRDPVKHGLVAEAFDWPHSSIHRDMRACLSAGAVRRSSAHRARV